MKQARANTAIVMGSIAPPDWGRLAAFASHYHKYFFPKENGRGQALSYSEKVPLDLSKVTPPGVVSSMVAEARMIDECLRKETASALDSFDAGQARKKTTAKALKFVAAIAAPLLVGLLLYAFNTVPAEVSLVAKSPILAAGLAIAAVIVTFGTIYAMKKSHLEERIGDLEMAKTGLEMVRWCSRRLRSA